MYGHMLNDQLIIVKTPGADDKSIIFTETPEIPEGYRAACAFSDEGTEIRQSWSLVKTDEPYPEPEAEPADYEEQLERLGVTL